jgi:hypothetical protein
MLFKRILRRPGNFGEIPMQARLYGLSRHTIGILCFLTSLSLLAVSCHANDSTAPQPARLVPPHAPSNLLVSADDPCWSAMDYDCVDEYTHDGGLIDGSNYGYLGGFGTCYSGNGWCGAGFGNWDDGSGCIVSETTPWCLSVVGTLKFEWRGCPAEIQFNSYNVSNGQMEAWILTRVGSYSIEGWNMGKYTGSYSSNGVTTYNVVGHMVCAAGYIAAVAHG